MVKFIYKRPRNKNRYKNITLISIVTIILLTLAPNISKCVANGFKSRHLSHLYEINYSLTDALLEENALGNHTWRSLLEENNSEKLLRAVSAEFFGGKLKTEEFHAENDGSVLTISSVKYPDINALKVKIPETSGN